MKKVLVYAMLVLAAGLLFSCTSDIESADEILARARGSSSSDGSSASVVQGVSSGGSSSSVVEVSSSSLALPSSSSAEPSSSGTATSSSVELSSSSVLPSSSSVVPSSSSNDVLSSNSSSAIPSSSGTVPSSSSVGLSSSSVELSSSSEAESSSSVLPSSNSVLPSSSSVVPSSGTSGTFVDIRNDKTYKWVKIGTQIWMAENLNYEVEGSKCYDNLDSNCDTYGRLYDWATAMNNSASSNAVPSKVQGVCPAGWHLPSDAEWDLLMDTVGGSSTAGTKLKATSGWNSNGNGSDEYGFSALPGGYSYSSGSFSGVGIYGRWWSATEGSASYAYRRDMGYSSAGVGRYDTDESRLYSVRCVQD